WDVAFIGAEPQRAAEIDFTAPYVEIEATYLVPAGSPIQSLGDVDRKGVRIAVAERSAYHLWLERNIKHATLVTAAGIEASYQVFVKDKLEVLAGLKPRLMEDVAKLAGSKILDGRFTAVQQAIGTPKGRPEGAAYLRKFAEDVKASGLVAQLIARHGIRGLSVAAPG
ncbi:MAG: transporter substrate-binding domain-containing protein, partial [Betaproteobacteria bacterium]|nr:transporter substrate-binding domain-containing protein [Betaproteobacteria bacterium]